MTIFGKILGEKSILCTSLSLCMFHSVREVTLAFKLDINSRTEATLELWLEYSLGAQAKHLRA